MSAMMLLTRTPLNPDDNFVLHGRSSSYSERDDYLNNSRLTNTTARLSQHTLYNPDNYKEKRKIYARSYTDMAHNLEYLSDKLDRTLSKSVSFRCHDDIDDGNKLFKYTLSVANKMDADSPLKRVDRSHFKDPNPGETLSTTIPEDKLLDMYEKHIGEIDSLSGRPISPREAQWYVNPNHLDSTGEAPTLQTLGHTINKGTDKSRRKFSDRDAVAMEMFPVTFGSAYEMRGEDIPEAKLAKLRKSQSLRMKDFDRKHDVDQLHLLAAEVPTIGSSTVYMMTPHQAILGKLRLERLKLEEAKLLELKRLEELERIRGPKPKWYESKGPDFYYESHKNTELMKNQSKFQQLFDYRQDLLRSSYNSLRKYNKTMHA